MTDRPCHWKWGVCTQTHSCQSGGWAGAMRALLYYKIGASLQRLSGDNILNLLCQQQHTLLLLADWTKEVPLATPLWWFRTYSLTLLHILPLTWHNEARTETSCGACAVCFSSYPKRSVHSYIPRRLEMQFCRNLSRGGCVFLTHWPFCGPRKCSDIAMNRR